jgi:putative N6-adenine-specific DNA methylase
MMSANLHLRTASRVLVEIGRFGARALGELERKGAGVAWDRLHSALGSGDPDRASRVRFRVSASRSRLYHEGAVEERLRRAAGLPPALEDAVSGADDDRPPEPDLVPSDGGGPVLVVARVHRDEVTVRIDTSGAHLHRRGYRTHVGIAPLRETLAAALLLARPRAHGDQAAADVALVDPLCGSGTVAIEGALLARRIPPGLASADREPRHYAFLDWPDLPAGTWGGLVSAARAGILSGAPASILASDRDPEVLDAAAANAERAGVSGDLVLSRLPLSEALDAAGPHGPGWVVTNPPYGGRLGDRRSLRALYAALGRGFRAGGPVAGWGLLYLSGDPVLDASTGLDLEPLFTTSHGGLEVRAMTGLT